MKIVVINGSPRPRGSTAVILDEIEQCLSEKDDVSVLRFDLGTQNLTQCTGCNLCFKTGACFIDDDAETISQSLAGADGIIIGSPTYASNVSGVLKTLIDRGHFVVEQLLYGKYALGIITGENYGASTAQSILKTLFQNSGAFVTSMVTVKTWFTKSPVLNDGEKILYRKKAEQLYKNIKQKQSHPFQKLRNSFVFNVGIKPFVLKKEALYDGVTHHWGNSEGPRISS